jgi:hypothetical protein
MSERNDLLERILFATQNAASGGLSNRIVVSQASDLSGQLDSSKEYFIDGVIDLSTQTIEVPAGGLTISGYGFDLSKLTSPTGSYSMFTSPVGGSGNLILKNVTLTASGLSSQVFNITSLDGTNALEIISVNYDNCTSLGEITGYRQLLETGTGRFGGTPELTFSGSWNGVRISTSIVRGLSNITSLFKAGAGLTFSGRFGTDINCDLPAAGALIDFAEANITNDESLDIEGAFITRGGVIDPTDTAIYPNIDETSVKSNWKANTGLPNTNKYIKGYVSTEILTTINTIDVYEILQGTVTIDRQVHFDMPVNGEYRLLTGTGSYQISGDISLEGTANNVIDIRITKSTDGGVTFPTEINHIRRQINSLVGGRDVGFFPINFVTELNKNDRIRLEVENKTSSNNVTMELDSYLIITEI